MDEEQLFETVTVNYAPPPLATPLAVQQELPPFTTRVIEFMLLDYQVQLGMGLLSAPILKPKIQIEGKTPEITEFIEKTIQDFWRKAMPKLLLARAYSIAGGEVLYERNESDGKIYFKDFRDVYPIDMGLIHRDNKVFGITVRMNPDQHTSQRGVETKHASTNHAQNKIQLWGMKGFIYVHRRRFSSWYGRSDLRPAYEPWLEKTNKYGAKHSKRLWFTKYAFTGGTLLHPQGHYDEIDEVTGQITKKSYRDLARTALNRMMNGAGFTFENVKGNELETKGAWQYIAPSLNGDGKPLLDNLDRVDLEILRGMGIPDDILTHIDGSGFGSASGKVIPLAAFFVSQTEILQAFFQQFENIVLIPLLKLNFGASVSDYKVVKSETDISALMPEDASSDDFDEINKDTESTNSDATSEIPKQESVDL